MNIVPRHDKTFNSRVKFIVTKRGKKRYSSPVTGLDRPRGFQEVRVPRFLDNGTGWQ